LEEVAAGLAAALRRADLAPALLLLAPLLRRRRLRHDLGRPRRRRDLALGRRVGHSHGVGSRCGLGGPRLAPRLGALGVFPRLFLDLGTHAGRELRRLRPGPGAGAVVGLAGDLAIVEVADLLGADLAVLRIGVAGLAAHGARELAASLVGPGPLA